jgi:hypothetical protein
MATTDEIEPDGIPPEIVRELRRQIIDRLAMLRSDGKPLFCACRVVRRARHGAQPKIAYATYEDAMMAARALVQLPGAIPIRVYPCFDGNNENWHHTSKISEGRVARRHTVYPPNWTKPTTT